MFSLAINQVLIMFAFMLMGYVLKISGKLPENASKILSTVMVYVCMPCLSFATQAKNMTVANFKDQGVTILAGLIVLAVSYVVALLLTRFFSKDDFEKGIFIYSFTIPNLGYMGYPIVEAVFGNEALFHMMMFVLPMNVFIYTKGISMLSPQAGKGFKGFITNPSIVGLFAGMIVGLSGLKLPEIVNDITSTASACMAPLAMMMTGVVIASKPLKELVKGGRPYLASVLRLIVLPLMGLLIMVALNVPDYIIKVAVATLAMPLGLNTVVFPEAYGGDGRPGARLAFVSHTMAVVTIPMVFGLIGLFVK